MTAFVAASVTASRTSAIASAPIPQSVAIAVSSRRTVRTPRGVPGIVASKQVAMVWAYPSGPSLAGGAAAATSLGHPWNPRADSASR